MISYRIAEDKDHAQIMTLIAQARTAIAQLGIDQWQDGYPEPEVIARDIRCGAGRVFEVDGCIAGYMAPLAEPEPVYDELDGEWLTQGLPYLTVHRMAIGDGHRGTGLSTAMLSWAEDFAREKGLASVRADTHRGNLAMRGLLKKRGYSVCGEVRYPVAAGDPIRVAYEKILK